MNLAPEKKPLPADFVESHHDEVAAPVGVSIVVGNVQSRSHDKVLHDSVSSLVLQAMPLFFGFMSGTKMSPACHHANSGAGTKLNHAGPQDVLIVLGMGDAISNGAG